MCLFEPGDGLQVEGVREEVEGLERAAGVAGQSQEGRQLARNAADPGPRQ